MKVSRRKSLFWDSEVFSTPALAESLSDEQYGLLGRLARSNGKYLAACLFVGLAAMAMVFYLLGWLAWPNWVAGTIAVPVVGAFWKLRTLSLRAAFTLEEQVVDVTPPSQTLLYEYDFIAKRWRPKIALKEEAEGFRTRQRSYWYLWIFGSQYRFLGPAGEGRKARRQRPRV